MRWPSLPPGLSAGLAGAILAGAFLLPWSGCGSGRDTSAESARTADCWGAGAEPGAPDSCADWLAPRAGVLGLAREPMAEVLAAGTCGPPTGCEAPSRTTDTPAIPTTGATPAPAEGWDSEPSAK